MIVGVGGQGTLLTSRILGGVMENAGYEVKVSEVHGMAQRGGSVVTFVRYGKEVAEPIVEEGQADVLIAFERLEALRYANFLKKDGVLIVNDWRIDPISVVMGAAKYPENIIENLEKTHTVYRIDAMDEALKTRGLDLIVCMLTDPSGSGSYLLANGERKDILDEMYPNRREDGFVNNLMSRKKQLLPAVIKALS